MLKAIAFGLAAGAAIEAWRAIPPDGPVSAKSAALVLVVAVLCAYLGGRWRGRGRGGATAIATARAEASAIATQQVNVAVVVPGAGAGATGRHAAAGGVLVPSETVPWLAEARPAPGDLFDGADLRDLAEVLDAEAEL